VLGDERGKGNAVGCVRGCLFVENKCEVQVRIVMSKKSENGKKKQAIETRDQREPKEKRERERATTV